MSSTVELQITARGGREAARDVQALRSQVSDLGPAAGSTKRQAGSLAAEVDRLDRSSRNARGSLGGLAGALGRGIGAAARVGAVGLGLVTAAAGAASVKSIGLARDAAETGSAFNTIFADQAGGLQQRLDGITDRFGLYGPAMQDAAKGFGVFGQAAGVAQKDLGGFSGDLIQAGLDLGSFHNADPTEVFQSLRSGLSGEAEPLRKFGIFLSDATMKSTAAQMGLRGELTESQKVMIRQRIILGGLGAAQGDLERTSESLANQQRAAGDRAKTLSTLWGQALEPAAAGLFRGLNGLLGPAIEQLSAHMPTLTEHSGRLGDKLQSLGERAGKALPKMLTGAQGLYDLIVKGDFTGKLGQAFGWEEDSQAVGVILGMRDAVTGLQAALSDPSAAESASSIGTSLAQLGPAVGEAAAAMPSLNDMLSVTSTVVGFAADNVDLLGKALPYLAAGFVAVKVGQLAANLAIAASIPMRIVEIGVNRQLVASNRALVVSQRAATLGTVVGTAATTTSTVATTASTTATQRLGLAMRAHPIGMVVTALGLLVGGLVLAYQKSETFRRIVDGALAGIKTSFFALAKGALWAIDNILAGYQAMAGAAGKLPGPLGAPFRAAEEAIGRARGVLNGFTAKLDEATRPRTVRVTMDYQTPGAGNVRALERRARGGPIVPGRPYIVGEEGPELIVSRDPRTVIPAPRTEQLLAGASRGSAPAALAAAAGYAPSTRLQVKVGRKVVADATLEELAERSGR